MVNCDIEIEFDPYEADEDLYNLPEDKEINLSSAFIDDEFFFVYLEEDDLDDTYETAFRYNNLCENE